MHKSKILIICLPSLAPYLAREVQSLGFQVNRQTNFNVEVEGTLSDTYQLNLYLRTANRVLFQIAQAKANHPDELYDQFRQIPWEEYFDKKTYIHVHSVVKNSFIRDTRFANLKAKDAIVDRFSQNFRTRPDSGPEKGKTVVFFHWLEDQVSVYLDTSGETLSKHNYRKTSLKAPMSEVLAAACIYASQWDQQSHFLNPMCGTGTLAIEAAMMACNLYPGMFRNNFGFMHLNGFDRSYWNHLLTEAGKHVQRNLNFKIIASDIDPQAVKAAQANAILASVDKLITFKTTDFKTSPVPPGSGTVMLNPEYGERLGQENELESVYRDIGNFFKQECDGYTGYVFTGNLQLAKHIGLKTSRRLEFFNARIDSRLLEYEIYAGSQD
ncbi:MAG: THUMP domain-containing class I SAM-dependent RNA methyltransferase [Candidatus Cyclobacteriaceae bacterium M3_2C_046]